MSVKKFTQEVVREGKRVRWPKRDTLLPAIATVLFIAIFAGIVLWLEDWAGNSLLQVLKDAFATLGNGGGAGTSSGM